MCVAGVGWSVCDPCAQVSGFGWGESGGLLTRRLGRGDLRESRERTGEAFRHDPIASPSSSSCLLPQDAPLLLLALLSVVLHQPSHRANPDPRSSLTLYPVGV